MSVRFGVDLERVLLIEREVRLIVQQRRHLALLENRDLILCDPTRNECSKQLLEIRTSGAEVVVALEQAARQRVRVICSNGESVRRSGKQASE